MNINFIREKFQQDYSYILENDKYIDDFNAGLIFESLKEQFPTRSIGVLNKKTVLSYEYFIVRPGSIVFDAIIAGGGPSGLLLTLFLVKNFDCKLLVFDQKDFTKINKSWVINEIDLNILLNSHLFEKKDIEDLIINTFDKVTFNYYQDNSNKIPFEIKTKTFLIDEKKFIELIIEELKKSKKALILSNERFLDLKLSKDVILVNTTKNSYMGKILIDATGDKSRLNTFLNYNHFHTGFYSIAGVKLRLNSNSIYKDLSFIYNRNSNSFFRISKDDIVYYKYSDKRAKLEDTIIEFFKNVKHIQDFDELNIDKLYYGYIPFYFDETLTNFKFKKQAPSDKVLLFGDCASYPSPLFGFGISSLLRNIQNIGNQIIFNINKNKLSQAALERIDINEKERISNNIKFSFNQIIETILSNKNLYLDISLILEKLLDGLNKENFLEEIFSDNFDLKTIEKFFKNMKKHPIILDTLKKSVAKSTHFFDSLFFGYKQLLNYELNNFFKSRHPLRILSSLFTPIYFNYKKVKNILSN